MSMDQEEKKKQLARTIRELYLYPFRTKEENIIRGASWIASWVVGVILQKGESMCELGGAFFIFSLSLLLEFVPESKKEFLPKIVHGTFCILTLFILFGSMCLSFGNTNSCEYPLVISVLISLLIPFGWIITTYMGIALMLALFEAHKFEYDEEAQNQKKNEDYQEQIRKVFNDKLNGKHGGGQ